MTNELDVVKRLMAANYGNVADVETMGSHFALCAEAATTIASLRGEVDALPVTAGEPVAWAMSTWHESPILNIQIKAMRADPLTKDYADRFSIPLYTAPQPVACPAGPETAARDAALAEIIRVASDPDFSDRFIGDVVRANLDELRALQSKEKR